MQFPPVSILRNFLGLALISAAPLHAGEIVIEPRPFEIVVELDAKAMPAKDVAWVRLQPEEWSSFSIIALADHGQSVLKGDTLVAFDAQAIDRRIADLKQSTTRLTLNLADARESLAQLKETAPHRLDAARRAAETAANDFEYFTKTDRKAEEEKSVQRLEYNRQRLDNEKEELRQLKQMYAADDVTEDTEEIILTRQQNAVKMAEFELRMATLQHERRVEVLLPRTAIDMANAKRDTAIAQRRAETSIPRDIELATGRLLALETELQRDQELLAKLQKDRALFEIKASADGIFYHGALDKGRWTTGELIRSLKVGGLAPLEQAFATLVPAGTPLELVAHTSASTARRLKTGNTGNAVLGGREDLDIPVTVEQAALVPDTDGQYAVRLKASWPKDIASAVHAGNPAKAQLVSYQNPKAIVIPQAALSYGSAGWQVKVKLADGKTEQRRVKRGAQDGGDIEILSGLEAGQVIITP